MLTKFPSALDASSLGFGGLRRVLVSSSGWNPGYPKNLFMECGPVGQHVLGVKRENNMAVDLLTCHETREMFIA